MWLRCRTTKLTPLPLAGRVERRKGNRMSKSIEREKRGGSCGAARCWTAWRQKRIHMLLRKTSRISWIRLCSLDNRTQAQMRLRKDSQNTLRPRQLNAVQRPRSAMSTGKKTPTRASSLKSPDGQTSQKAGAHSLHWDGSARALHCWNCNGELDKKTIKTIHDGTVVGTCWFCGRDESVRHRK